MMKFYIFKNKQRKKNWHIAWALVLSNALPLWFQRVVARYSIKAAT